MTGKLYYKYWGKARAVAETGPAYHLLAYHCLDVAAVADQWWKNSPALRHQFRRSTQLAAEEKTYAWLMFFICLHDLGKLDIRFQMKSPETIRRLQTENYSSIKAGCNKLPDIMDVFLTIIRW